MSRPRTMMYPDSEQVATTYDVQGPMTLGAYVLGADYWASGQLKVLNLASGVSTSYTYNLQNRRLTNLKTGNLQNLAYEYDAVGNITKVTDAIRVETSNYEYDDLDRLKKAYITGVYTQEWTHSPIGNITWRKDNGVQTNYTYNATTRPHAVTQVGSTAYSYDGNGNMTARGGDGFTYDYENRLTNANVGGVTTQYAYNGDGARVKKVVGSTATYYVGNWYEVTNGAVTKYYYFGAQRVAMRNANGVTYLHGDHLGSTSVTSGAQVSQQTYYAFGSVRTTSGSLPTDYAFTGQKADSYIKLIQMGARWYDPEIGKFTQPDSIIPHPGNPQSFNRYSYVINNPLRYTDPTGHDFWESLNDFWIGATHQWAYDNLPPSQARENALGIKPNETIETTVGRHVGNLVALGQGIAETVVGINTVVGGGLGGAATCLETAGGGCAAGGAVMGVGVAVTVHGLAVETQAALEEGALIGDAISKMTGKGTGGRPESTRSQMEKSIRSLEKRIAEHQEKIDKRIGFNPVSDDPVINARAAASRLEHLQTEIDGWQKQISDLQKLLDSME